MRLFALGLVWALTSGPGLAQGQFQVVIGSKADTEGALLGSMIALALEREGIPVDLRLQLGPSRKVRSALLSGEIDTYPEYTGNGASSHQREGDPAWRSPDIAFETIKRPAAERHKLVWFPRLPPTTHG
ncbi:glycine betaine ABC transporter substrate-binding protein [Microvirga vignae]|uniref:glycine betaine ABC transporter substrate-binding protein n=1 Tax=Microvirga vignae TaxID=1225564 RepID=UPI001FCD040C|nr:glycine betaine ABC transporter substrate-binding protein [Microvirga vignae]